MDFKELVRDIIPHYNKYRQNRDILTGAESLEIFWDIGDLLRVYIEQNKIAPHALYRQIYGKSEGKDNVVQKSYITRDFLSRSYRVRNIFKDKKEIKNLLPGLKRFRAFYQAMPFFDNSNYKFIGKNRKNLLKLLNSNKSYGEIMKEIFRLQKEKIGIKNPRTQKLQAMAGDKEIFDNFYNFVKEILNFKDYNKAKNLFDDVSLDLVKIISRNTAAISVDGLQMYKFSVPQKINKNWLPYVLLIEKLVSKDDSQDRRRFRRLVKPEKMIQLSEMLFALTAKEEYDNYRL
jgi:hypothetical protein